MMIRYRYSKQKKRTTVQKLLRIVIPIGIVLSVSAASFAFMLGGWAHGVIAPIWRQGADVRINTLNSLVRVSKAELARENKELRETVYRMSVLVADRMELAAEKERLETIMNRHPALDVVPALVLARADTSPYTSYVLDVGSRDGIAVGDEVAVGGIGVGQISAVYTGTSRMVLYSDAGNGVDVLLGEKKTPAVANGRGGGNYLIELPRDIDVAYGDTIIARYGPLRLIGSVEVIEVQPNDPFKRILFKTPVDMSRIRWVEIYRKHAYEST